MEYQEIEERLKGVFKRFATVNEKLDSLQTAIEEVKAENTKQIYRDMADKFTALKPNPMDIHWGTYIGTGVINIPNTVVFTGSGTMCGTVPITVSGTTCGNIPLPTITNTPVIVGNSFLGYNYMGVIEGS